MTFSCEIIFNRNPAKVFYTGQILRGYIHLALKNQQYIRGIDVHLNGIVLASWQIGRAFRRCKEDCLNVHKNIIGEMCLAARTYKLPFCFLLPVKIPSSFEGEFGFIRYTVTAVIDIPFQINKKSAERVTILKMIDWNDPDLQKKVSASDGFNPYFSLSYFPWFPIKIDAHIESGTYPPCATIDLGINVTNRSFRRIRNFTVQLIKEATYYSYDQTRITKSIVILSESELRDCSQNQKHTLCLGCKIRIPHTSPSDSGSIIIKVRHFIRITASMGRNYNPSLELPITIVAIPGIQPNTPELSI